MDSLYSKYYSSGSPISTSNVDFEKGAISKNLLGDLSEGALQAGPMKPAANQAQIGKSGSNAMQDAYKAVNQFWQGNPEAPFIESLGREDQSNLQQLAVNDPQEYYRELGRRKSFASQQRMPKQQDGGVGGFGGRSRGGGFDSLDAGYIDQALKASDAMAEAALRGDLEAQKQIMDIKAGKYVGGLIGGRAQKLAKTAGFAMPNTFTKEAPFSFYDSSMGTVGGGSGMATF